MKKKLCISFSMGETSGFMTQWCLDNLKDEYEMVVVCANTGEEDEESLKFGDQCDKYFGWNMVWVEAVVDPEFGKGTEHRIVTFETASRKGEPFEDMIAKFGIPNSKFKHCNRELKLRPITSYLRDGLGWSEYYTAVGIRADETSRITWDKAAENRIIYPLVTNIRITKPHINSYWSKMPFRLNIKSYEGNCKTCWKKSKRKLMTIAQEHPERFEFFRKMEQVYGDFIPPSRDQDQELPIRFFRGNESVEDIFEESKFPFPIAIDEKLNTAVQTSIWDEYLDSNFGCTESCEAF